MPSGNKNVSLGISIHLTRHRVRRDELQSPTSSPRSSPDPEIIALLRSRIQQEYTFTAVETDTALTKNVPHSDGEEAELQLFAASPNATPKTYKIRLLSPDASVGEIGFKVKKPRSYYFADEPTTEEKFALQAAAIDEKALLELSKEPWPACTLPWKVHKISAAGMKKEVLIGHPPNLFTVEEKVRKRTRKNKKTRIAIRKKLQASKHKQEEKARLAQEQEEAEREKRTRRNREKKVKKKAREKAKKALIRDVEKATEQIESE